MKVGDEKRVLEGSLQIIELLYCWVNGVGISFEESRKIDKKCAEELWNGCKFDVPDRTKLPSKSPSVKFPRQTLKRAFAAEVPMMTLPVPAHVRGPSGVRRLSPTGRSRWQHSLQ
jgi:hypothetical protein